MFSLNSKPPIQTTEPTFSLKKLGLSGTGVVLGVTAVAAVAFGYSQWKTQQTQLALLAQMVQQMQIENAQDASVAAGSFTSGSVGGEASFGASAAVQAEPTLAISDVTPLSASLSETAADAAPTSQAQTLTAMIASAAGAAPASAETVRVPEPSAALALATAVPDATISTASTTTTADKLRSLTERAAAYQGDDEQARRVRRMETLATIDAGVQQLVDAVVAGDYDIHTNYKDETFEGRIHFAFVGHEKDQTELEQFLAQAAADGFIAHSSSVVGSDGSINGHIMLFDLVERAMENGTLAEQRAGQKLRAEAAKMLAETVTVGEPANSAGEKFYVVERGDSLAYIALQFYGNTNDYAKIFEANRDKIANPEKINIGQRLRIPNV